MNWGAAHKNPSNSDRKDQAGGNQGALQWGSGFQGGRGNSNRFAPLAGQNQNQSFNQNQSQGFNQNRNQGFNQNQNRGFNQNQNRGFNQNQNQNQNRGFNQNRQFNQAGRGQAPDGDWRQIVSGDWQQERPKWPCSAYSHIKAAQGQQGGANDLEGEFSADEFRWAQMQAAAQGVPSQQLSAELGVLKAAQDRQWQALSQARMPPSLGGPPIPPITTLLPGNHSLMQLYNTQQGSAMQHGIPATPSGQVVNAFGRFPSLASNVPSTTFGVANSQQPTFGTSGFAVPVNPSEAGFGSAFKPGMPQASPQVSETNLANIPEAERVWAQTAFEKGKIPDQPPPRQYCV